MNPDGFMSILTKFKRKSSSVKSGSDDFCQAIQNNFYKMEKGDILLIAPGVLHKTPDESPAEYERAVINFPPKLLDNIAGNKDMYMDFAKKK